MANKATAKTSASTPEVAPEVVAEQFPALLGEPEVENAKRSADEEDARSTVFEKDFVILARAYDNDEEFHENNIIATRQFLVHQGLRPLEHGRFVGSEEHTDGESLILHYEVKVTPAVIAEGEVAHPFINEENK